MSRDPWPSRVVRVGPFSFLLRSPLSDAIETVDRVYRDYPREAPDGIVDYTVAVAPTSKVRRYIRPKIEILADVMIPLMEPQPAVHAGLAFEMGMNLQIAAGMHRYLLLHAGSAKRDGKSVLLIGDTGAGKSTLSAALAYHGWRFFGDEMALVDLETGELWPFPRPVSLKNAAIGAAREFAPEERFGPTYTETLKGTVRHLLPPTEAIAAMDRPAPAKLILAPGFAAGAAPSHRRMTPTEAFVRLNQSSANAQGLGEAGFLALHRLATTIPAFDIGYSSTADALALVDELWGAA